MGYTQGHSKGHSMGALLVILASAPALAWGWKRTQMLRYVALCVSLSSSNAPCLCAVCVLCVLCMCVFAAIPRTQDTLFLFRPELAAGAPAGALEEGGLTLSDSGEYLVAPPTWDALLDKGVEAAVDKIVKKGQALLAASATAASAAAAAGGGACRQPRDTLLPL